MCSPLAGSKYGTMLPYSIIPAVRAPMRRPRTACCSIHAADSPDDFVWPSSRTSIFPSHGRTPAWSGPSSPSPRTCSTSPGAGTCRCARCQLGTASRPSRASIGAAEFHRPRGASPTKPPRGRAGDPHTGLQHRKEPLQHDCVVAALVAAQVYDDALIAEVAEAAGCPFPQALVVVGPAEEPADGDAQDTVLVFDLDRGCVLVHGSEWLIGADATLT